MAGIGKKDGAESGKDIGINKGTLSVGADADIIIVNPDKEWIVEKSWFLSKSKNSAFLGRKFQGVVEYTICAGEISEWNS